MTIWRRSSGRGHGWWRSRGPRTRSGRWSTPSGCAGSRTTPARSPGVDAVHYAAHEPIDVRQIDADVLICSPYKFCGPLGRRFETGTLPYELLAGFNATIDYLDSIGGFDAIVPYERSLGDRFLAGISDAVSVYGLPGMEGRVPTFLINVAGVPAPEVAVRLAEQSMGVWAYDSWYSLDLYRRPGYDDQAVRLGFIHYNTIDEVDRLVGALPG